MKLKPPDKLIDLSQSAKINVALTASTSSSSFLPYLSSHIFPLSLSRFPIHLRNLRLPLSRLFHRFMVRSGTLKFIASSYYLRPPSLVPSLFPSSSTWAYCRRSSTFFLLVLVLSVSLARRLMNNFAEISERLYINGNLCEFYKYCSVFVETTFLLSGASLFFASFSGGFIFDLLTGRQLELMTTKLRRILKW